MKGRDLLILAAVLLVIGFALADSLRSDETRVEVRPTTTEPSAESTTTTAAEDDDLGEASFPRVNGAPGSIVLAEAGTCAIREFDLPTGLEYPNVVERSTCDLWAPPVTAKVAVGIAEPLGDAVPFRFLDLSRLGRDLGSSEAAFGILVWSQDGQRAAWCNRHLEGIDLELGGDRRMLEGGDCPAAYTPDGEVATVQGDQLYVEGRPTLRASGVITYVHFATYGAADSVAVIVEGRRIERYDRRHLEDRLELTDALDLPERYEGLLPEFSPENCSAAFPVGDRIRVLNLGCSYPERARLSDQGFPGQVAAWSEIGDWLAVGSPTDLTFYNLASRHFDPVRWPIGVAEIVWRRS